MYFCPNMGKIAVTEVYLIWCRHAGGYSKAIKYTMNISRLLLQWPYGQRVYTIYGKLYKFILLW